MAHKLSAPAVASAMLALAALATDEGLESCLELLPALLGRVKQLKSEMNEQLGVVFIGLFWLPGFSPTARFPRFWVVSDCFIGLPFVFLILGLGL